MLTATSFDECAAQVLGDVFSHYDPEIELPDFGPADVSSLDDAVIDSAMNVRLPIYFSAFDHVICRTSRLIARAYGEEFKRADLQLLVTHDKTGPGATSPVLAFNLYPTLPDRNVTGVLLAEGAALTGAPTGQIDNCFHAMTSAANVNRADHVNQVGYADNPTRAFMDSRLFARTATSHRDTFWLPDIHFSTVRRNVKGAAVTGPAIFVEYRLEDAALEPTGNRAVGSFDRVSATFPSLLVQIIEKQLLTLANADEKGERLWEFVKIFNSVYGHCGAPARPPMVDFTRRMRASFPQSRASVCN